MDPKHGADSDGSYTRRGLGWILNTKGAGSGGDAAATATARWHGLKPGELPPPRRRMPARPEAAFSSLPSGSAESDNRFVMTLQIHGS